METKTNLRKTQKITIMKKNR